MEVKDTLGHARRIVRTTDPSRLQIGAEDTVSRNGVTAKSSRRCAERTVGNA